MKILIASGNPYIPQWSGGIESSTHELALELRRRGHEVSVVCRLEPTSLSGWIVRLIRLTSRQRFPVERWLGYPVYRLWEVQTSIPEVIADLKPDVAIVQIGDMVRLAHKITDCGLPVLFYLHNIDVEQLNGGLEGLTGVTYIANSSFTARRYKEHGFDSVVIPPLFRAKRYMSRRRPANVTFINPIDIKGKQIALQIAEHCPEIPFCFVESWTLSEQDLADLRARIASLPNVTLRRRTDNMKSVYSKAKIVLAPSMCEETWGRIVTEAHYTGIPVVASNVGGLPQAVGPGGVLLDSNGPIEPWIDAIRKLWHDEAYYGEISAAALAYSQRPEINPDVQIDKILAAAEQAISQRHASSGG